MLGRLTGSRVTQQPRALIEGCGHRTWGGGGQDRVGFGDLGGLPHLELLCDCMIYTDLISAGSQADP